MKAIHVVDPGPDSRLVIKEMDKPTPGPHELLVHVKATALNRADLMQRKGHYPPPPGTSEILGLEMAGVVEAWGNECFGWQAGDPVFGLLASGGYAEYVTIAAPVAMRMPGLLTFEQAAAIPEVFLTAYQALDWLGNLKAGETVLIHAGGSGVGTAAIQLAKQRGAKVFVTASAGKHAACLALGADAAIDYKSEDFPSKVIDMTAGAGVDLVIDFIGAPYFEMNINSLALDGRLVLLAMMGGSKVDSFNLSHLFRKRIHFKTSTLRSRSLAYKSELTQSFVRDFMPLLEDGSIGPIIDRVFDWSSANEAHEYMAANKNTGKLVLRVG